MAAIITAGDIEFDLILTRGQQAVKRFQLQDKDDAGVLTDTDLTGASAKYQIREGPETSDVLILTKTEAVPATEIEFEAPATGGILILKFIRADTDGLNPGQVYWHELWVFLADARDFRVFRRSPLQLEDRLVEPLV